MKKVCVLMCIMLLFLFVFALSSSERSIEIVYVEVIQLPFKTVYMAGADDYLVMDGCIMRVYLRSGEIEDFFYDSTRFATLRHEIDFLTPGEYDVFFTGETIRLVQ